MAQKSETVNLIKDSGARVNFESGARRDIKEGKGRTDLMPIKEVGIVLREFDKHEILKDIDAFMKTGETEYLGLAIKKFVTNYTDFTLPKFMLEVSKHYEQGALKYGERNWEKGIPLHSYIDSATRHLIVHLNGDRDEPHDRAFVWNLLGAMWTMENRPECIDINFALLGKNFKK